MPPEVEWPEWRGRSLSFLAQFRLDDLKRRPEFSAGEGVLRDRTGDLRLAKWARRVQVEPIRCKQDAR
jgi:hypothetical protein